MTHVFDQAFWDGMYRNRQAAWDGEPNSLLAETVDGLAPGTALDVGCGEGADAIWLARRGWRVTAMDLSEVALDRARAADPEGRLTWLHADLLSWQPPTAAFDLVSGQFLHIPPAERPAFFGRLAQAVRPGGRLLFVAHHPSDLENQSGRPAIPDLYFTAEEVAALLVPGRWEPLVAGTQAREVTTHDGRAITIHDMVLEARRLA